MPKSRATSVLTFDFFFWVFWIRFTYEMASADSSRVNDHVSSGSSSGQGAAPPALFEVVKVYPSRGPMTQYRLASATTFTCSRCQRQKTAKLVATRNGQWDALLCNGCYGFIISRE
ncbi:uncharacterized protein LAJ45_02755 [Morchella importuna]|nr:uncharacterized protein LAJ45_02755 [Morchella importuna]KAH8153168.1 hypothetical protein LAJ45_02755 [Morchella importuna]